MNQSQKSVILKTKTRARLGRVAPLDRLIQYTRDTRATLNAVSLVKTMAKPWRSRWPPFSIPAERIPSCIFGENLVILAQVHYKLLWRQSIFPILSRNGQIDIESQGQWPLLSIPAESITGCMFGANWVILAPIYDELSREQAKFPRILSDSGLKWPWRLKSMTTIFYTNREYPKMHVWCKFGVSRPNLWRISMRTR